MATKKTITILNHGTMNSSGDDLVISRLKSHMVGLRGGTWMLNTGVGTFAQAMDRHYLPGWNALGGTFWAKGINKNVDESVAFVKEHCKRNGAAMTQVNMAGHSRGSMTALKIAHALQKDDDTKGCDVNLFLIDPVPGNLGWVNSGMYKDIAISGNVKNAYMILAESERRNAFRPYVDKAFLYDMPTHRMDTIPGNHGGINELEADGHHESADVVLHHAVKFLFEHGTDFNNGGQALQSTGQLLELYATIMVTFQKYKKQGHASRNLEYSLFGGMAKGDRKVQVQHRDKKVGWANVPGLEKNEFDGKAMKGMAQQVPSLAGLSRESRFFANHDHKSLFRVGYPSASAFIEKLEMGGNPQTFGAMVSDAGFRSDRDRMGERGLAHLLGWMQYASGAA